MGDPAIIKRLKELREAKVRPAPDQSAGRVAGVMRDKLVQAERGLRGVGGVWDVACPAELVERTEVVGVSRGVLRVRVSDSATRYELSRWLRGGGERAVIEASRHPIRKVKLEGQVGRVRG